MQLMANQKKNEMKHINLPIFTLAPDLLNQVVPHSFNAINKYLQKKGVDSGGFEYLLNKAYPQLVYAVANTQKMMNCV